jgi:hypothetical protein
VSFTFINDPANVDRDKVRVLINDTSETTNSLSDETIAWLLSEHSNVWYAAAAACDLFAGTYASAVSEKQVGDLKLKTGAGDPAKQWHDMAKRYRTQAAVKGFKAYSGGISISDADSELADSDRPADQATVGMHDNDGGGSTGARWWF